MQKLVPLVLTAQERSFAGFDDLNLVSTYWTDIDLIKLSQHTHLQSHGSLSFVIQKKGRIKSCSLEGFEQSSKHKPNQQSFGYEAEHNVHSFAVKIVSPFANAFVL